MLKIAVLRGCVIDLTDIEKATDAWIVRTREAVQYKSIH